MWSCPSASRTAPRINRMVLLDTDVLSELMKAQPEPKVRQWVLSRRGGVYICAINKAEIEYGIAKKPLGRRKTELEKSAAKLFAAFAGRCLPFDGEDCPHYADIRAAERKGGGPLGGDTMMADAMIAAIARRHRLTLATRNIRDFPKQMDIVDPWR